MQKEDGIHPWKLLLLEFRVTRLLVFSHMVDGNSPANRLFEMFNTCSGCSDVDKFSSCRLPSRRLKLTSKTTMLPENITSSGRLPESELYDRLRCNKLVMPSHMQQFLLFRHDAARPLSRESPERHWRRDLFSCSEHEVAIEAEDNSSATARPKEGTR